MSRYATGDRTFLGNIASSTLNTVKNQSTLNIEIHHFIKIMATIAISLGVVFFIIAITAVQYPILEVPARPHLHLHLHPHSPTSTRTPPPPPALRHLHPHSPTSTCTPPPPPALPYLHPHSPTSTRNPPPPPALPHLHLHSPTSTRTHTSFAPQALIFAIGIIVANVPEGLLPQASD